MTLQPTIGVFGQRPPVTKPDPRFLQAVGEARFRQLVADHYTELAKSDIASMFPQDENDLEAAKKHAADFMIQISGGPAYFNESRGAPRMVGRHAPFAITPEARLTWLMIYKPLLEELATEIDPALVKSFWDYLDIFSIWMINKPS
jgi:hemoglobin